jgi:hypothetical protein
MFMEFPVQECHDHGKGDDQEGCRNLGTSKNVGDIQIIHCRITAQADTQYMHILYKRPRCLSMIAGSGTQK